MYSRRYDLGGKDSVDATAFAYAEMKKPITEYDRLVSKSPEKWQLDAGLCVGYRLREPTDLEMSWEVPRRFFYFSLIDAVRFDLWRLRVNSEKEKREKNEKLAEVIECWQHDIDEYRKALEVRK